MLQLLANKTPLALENASFNLTLRSPLAGEEAGSFVFSVTVPYEPNARTFGFPFKMNRLQVQTASASGVIMFSGTRVQQGTWNARSSMAKTIELEMVIGGSHFNTLVDGVMLPELFDINHDLGDYLISHANARVSKSWPEIEYQFPSILNKSFYGEEVNPDFSGIINYYNDDSFDDKTVNYTALVPQLFLLYIIKHLFISQNYTVSGPVLDDTYLQKALLYNNFAIDRVVPVHFHAAANMDINYTPFTVLWDTNIVDPQDLYNELTGKYKVATQGTYRVDVFMNGRVDYSGTILEQAEAVITLKYGTTIVATHLVDIHSTPYPHWIYLNVTFQHTVEIADINDYFSVQFAYLDDKLDPFQSWIEHGSIDIINKTYPLKNVFGRYINYKNHVPNMDIKEFLTAFYTAFQIMPFFNHELKTVELYFLQDLLGKHESVTLTNGLIEDTLKVYPNTYNGLTIKFDFQGPDDLLTNNFITPEIIKYEIDKWLDLSTYIPALGDIYYVHSLNCYIEYQFIEGETEEEDGWYEWVTIGDKHVAQIIDAGEETITTSLAPMLMRFNSLDLVDRNLPSVEAAGTSEAFGIKNDFPLRIMFYTGLQNKMTSFIEDVNPYPYATTTRYNSNANEILPVNYRFDELITRYLLPVIAWWKRRMKVEFTHLVTPSFIQQLDMKKPLFFENSILRVTEIVVKIKNKMFGPGDFTGWTG